MKKIANPQLDDLYLPLRFDEKFDINQTECGQVLDLDALLALLAAEGIPDAGKRKSVRKKAAPSLVSTSIRKQSLAITGAAGAGKTTWMRYTFRRMREDDRVLPLFVELRAVAKFWNERKESRDQHSIEAYLAYWLAEYVPSFPNAGVTIHDLLAAPSDWFPVLLVDGWDELGDLGGAFREKLLGTLNQYSRLLVIASSRPYGSDRPSSSDGFVQQQVQPLNAVEIATFSLKFYQKCYGEEEKLAGEQADAFGKALARSEDAKLLAKTPLLLTMMLFINRSKRLPDKRHQLYEECLNSLLSERPGMQAGEGVRLQQGEWCPDFGGPQLLQIVARMAYDLQTNHTRSEEHERAASSIIVSKDLLKQYLPTDWKPWQRDGFVLWLCSRAGIMSDDAQDNIWFVHLSFQEFLTARHLTNTVVGEEAPRRFPELAQQPLWWETLLLWAALLNDQAHERAEPLLDSLLDDKASPLVGMMLADGIGTPDQMQRWVKGFVTSLDQEWPEQTDRCLRAWQASRQKERREHLATWLRKVTASTNWLTWLRRQSALSAIGSEADCDIPAPRSCLQIPIAVLYSRSASPGNIESPQQFAGARVLHGINPLLLGYSVGLLHLWPSRRSRLSHRLQTQCSLGTARLELQANLQQSLQSSPALSGALTRDLVQVLASVLTLDLDLGRARDFIRARDRTLARTLARARTITRVRVLALAHAHARFGSISLSRFLAPPLLRTLLCYFVHPAFNDLPDTLLPLSLLVDAAHASVFSDSKSIEELQSSIGAVQDRSLDPFWVSFARWIARQGTPSDRALLEDYAIHPEKCEGSFSWGLQYIVRGDLLLPDGTEVTLDELCTEAGIPPYPLLEEMPLDSDT